MGRFGQVILLFFLSVVVAVPAQAQMVRDHDGHSLRSFHGKASRIRRSFQSDGEARAVFKHILAVSGLSGMEDRITIRASAETDNAEAFVEKTADKEERLIFYNAVFMQEIAKKTEDYWSMIAILAHEFGHHIRLHTVIPGRDHEFELEADYQAGFILRRMGATLEQAQAAFRMVGPEAATSSHPGRAQRVQAATLGWTDGALGGAPPGMLENQPQLSEAERSRIAQYVQQVYLKDREEFDSLVDYYEHGLVSRELVLQHKRKHEADWRIRNYELVLGTLQIAAPSPGQYLVKYQYRFTVAKTAGAKEIRGKGQTTLSLKLHDGKILVTGVKDAK